MNELYEVNAITIVGGGTSGWLTAAYLSNKYPNLKVTLVDKEESTPVGVGEGTLLSFANILYNCGFEIKDWFFEIDASFKSGILFPKWGKDESDVWHPFIFQKTTVNGVEASIIDLWSKDQAHDFKESALGLYHTSINNKVDQHNIDYYAFHIDAIKLVNFLQKEIVKRHNFTLIKSSVTKFNNSLYLENGLTIESDLFIDCTGFKKLLSSNDEMVDLTDRLYCDTAIAARVPYNDQESEMHPYVISEKVEHGWVWNIPIQTRIGSGLVFNRSITSIEEAKQFLIKYWDNRIAEEDLRVLDWTPKYSKTPWSRNVISIGLSAGFIEPLESTGIALIIAGIEKLELILHNRYYTSLDIDYYNLSMQQDFEDAIDFVNMHYDNQPANSKFWSWVSRVYKKSEKYKFYKKQLQRSDVPLLSNPTRHFFSSNNWICWLVQKGCAVGNSNINISNTDASNVINLYAKSEVDKIKTNISHSDFIKGF